MTTGTFALLYLLSTWPLIFCNYSEQHGFSVDHQLLFTDFSLVQECVVNSKLDINYAEDVYPASIKFERYFPKFLYARSLSLPAELMRGNPMSTSAVAGTIHVSSASELNAALTRASGGETIILKGGHYGDLSLQNLRFSSDVKIKAENPDDQPIISKLSLSNVANLDFDGVKFDYSFSSGEKDSASPFQILASSNITISNSIFDGDVASGVDEASDGYGTGRGLYINNSQSVSIDNNEFFNWHRAAFVANSQNVAISNNDIHDIRSDGLDFANVNSIVIENNHIHDFRKSPKSTDHMDMIQFWTSGTTSPSTNIIIRQNFLDMGSGDATQSIFMRNELVDQGLAGGEMYYSNILIEDNVIRNAHAHGITIGETNGLIIRNNTLLQAITKELGGTISIPKINLSIASYAVAVTNNIVPVDINYTGTLPTDWVLNGNFFAQIDDQSAANFIGNLLVDSLTNSASDLSNYLAVVGGLIERLGVGSILTRFDTTPDRATGFILSDSELGLARLAQNFDASNLYGPNGQIDTTAAGVTWDFGDGTSGSGLTTRHRYDQAGIYVVKAIVMLANGQTVEVDKTIKVDTPLALNADFDNGAQDTSDIVNALANEAQATFETAAEGRAVRLNDGVVTYDANAELFNNREFTLLVDFKKDAGGELIGGRLVYFAGSFVVTVGANNLEVSLTTDRGTSYLKAPTSGIDDSDWHKLAVTFSGKDGAAVLYLDGREVARVGGLEGAVQVGNPSHDLHLGGPFGGSFVGLIDNLQFWRGAMTADQIREGRSGSLDGNDTLKGTAGNDSLGGQAGDDVLIGGMGADVLDGGEGVDTAAYETAVTISMLYPANNTGEAKGDSFVSIERFQLSALGDKFSGSASADSVDGGAGNDLLFGLAGEDLLAASDGDDQVFGGLGNDRINAAAGLDTVILTGLLADYEVVNLSGDTYLVTDLRGDDGDGSDTVSGVELFTFSDGTLSLAQVLGQFAGTPGSDKIVGTNRADVLLGLEGNDTLVGRMGADTVNGGAGVDTASYEMSSSGLVVSLKNPVLGSGDATGDRFVAIENLAGSSYADMLAGDDSANVIQGGQSDDTLDGGSGDDLLDGGSGIDVASYISAKSAVTLSLAATGAQDTKGAGIDRLSSIENLFGSNLADKLTGNGSGNVLEGRAGADRIVSGLGNDKLLGGAGDDDLNGGDGVDVAVFSGLRINYTFSVLRKGSYRIVDLRSGGDGQDNLSGVEQFEFLDGSFTLSDMLGIIEGNNRSNKLIGTASPDTLVSLGGNDILIGLGGGDVYDGGAGIDTISYADSKTSVAASLRDERINSGGASNDRFISIENLIGSDFDDVLKGDSGTNVLAAGYGNDTIEGGAEDDELNGGFGIDTASYASSAAAVVVSLGIGTTQNTFGAGIDRLAWIENLFGSSYSDDLSGNGMSNNISGGAAGDTISGAGGNDTLAGGWGGDLLDGQSGRDTASYLQASAAVRASLQSVEHNYGEARGDQYLSIENLEGSAFDDVLVGDEYTNRLTGNSGNDTLSGGLGNDSLDGGTGRNQLSGGEGADLIIGTGTSGNTIDGGGGVDTLSYEISTRGVVASLAPGVSGSPWVSGDTLSSIERVLGSEFGDTLIGGIADDHIQGYGGNDFLWGKGGDDWLNGGAGSDRFTGGLGNDLMFAGSNDSQRDVFYLGGVQNTGRDTIRQFEHGVDKIVFQAGIQLQDIAWTETSYGVRLSYGSEGSVMVADQSWANTVDDLIFL